MPKKIQHNKTKKDLQERSKEQWPLIKNIGDIFLKHVRSHYQTSFLFNPLF